MRLSREHRNGDRTFGRFKHGGAFVSCSGEKDIGAYFAAFEILLEEDFTREEINAYRAKHKPPSHD